MKRTLQPKKRQLETNIGLIRKIAWSFHNSTGEDWNDLFQEASLAYCEALQKYNPKKGKITTYMWWCISSHLVNYLHLQYRQNGHIECIEDLRAVDRPVESVSLFGSLSKEAKEIANMVLSSPEALDGLSPQLIKNNIIRILLKQKRWSRFTKKWATFKIKARFRELKIAVS